MLKTQQHKDVCDYEIRKVLHYGTKAVSVKCCTNEAAQHLRERLVSNGTTQLSKFSQ